MLHGAALHVPHDELKFCEVVKKTCPIRDVSGNRVYPKQFLDSNVDIGKMVNHWIVRYPIFSEKPICGRC